jgi:pantothenate kinase-related protein Tda10
MIQTNNPYTLYVPDKYDPNHFMPWVHPFTSVISGPSGSGKSVSIKRFVHNILQGLEVWQSLDEFDSIYGSV